MSKTYSTGKERSLQSIPLSLKGREIAQTLKLLQTEEVNWQAVNENVIRLARNFDDEIDDAKRDLQDPMPLVD